MERLLIISADGHAAGPPEVYLPYMDKSFRELAYARLLEDERRYQGTVTTISLLQPGAVEEIDDEHVIRSGGGRGAWDIKTRLEQMDREGIAAEVVFPGSHSGLTPFLDIASGKCPPEFRDHGSHAYHRWLADHIGSEGKGRVFGVAYPGSARDLNVLIKEMHWAAEHGFVAVGCPGNVADPELPPLYDPHWEPFWQACVDLNLVVTVHAGFRAEQGYFLDLCDDILRNIKEIEAAGGEVPLNRIELIYGTMQKYGVGSDGFSSQSYSHCRALWELMLGGVFDRHPTLTVVPTEVHVDWMPSLFAHLDARYDAGDLPLAMRPSAYWKRNCYGGATNIKRGEVEMRHQIGVDRMVFGRDYPHPESTWPNTWDWLRAAFKGVPVDEARLILGENAARCYSLDRPALLKVAARIGPKPEEILGDFEISAKYLKNFNDRGAFTMPAQIVEPAVIDQYLREDIAGSRANRL